MLARKQIFADALAASMCRSPPISAGCSTSARAIAPRPRGFCASSRTICREEEAERVLETVINWGRHAEIFAYDYDSEVLSLENF